MCDKPCIRLNCFYKIAITYELYILNYILEQK